MCVPPTHPHICKLYSHCLIAANSCDEEIVLLLLLSRSVLGSHGPAAEADLVGGSRYGKEGKEAIQSKGGTAEKGKAERQHEYEAKEERGHELGRFAPRLILPLRIDNSGHNVRVVCGIVFARTVSADQGASPANHAAAGESDVTMQA